MLLFPSLHAFPAARYARSLRASALLPPCPCAFLSLEDAHLQGLPRSLPPRPPCSPGCPAGGTAPTRAHSPPRLGFACPFPAPFGHESWLRPCALPQAHVTPPRTPPSTPGSQPPGTALCAPPHPCACIPASRPQPPRRGPSPPSQPPGKSCAVPPHPRAPHPEPPRIPSLPGSQPPGTALCALPRPASLPRAPEPPRRGPLPRGRSHLESRARSPRVYAPPSHPGPYPQPGVAAPWNRSVRSPRIPAPRPRATPPRSSPLPGVAATWKAACAPPPHPRAPRPRTTPDPRPAPQALHPERSGQAEPPGDRDQDPNHRHDSTDVGNREAPCSGPDDQRAGRPGQEIHGRTLHARKASRTRCLQGQGAFPESELREPRGAESGCCALALRPGAKGELGTPGRLPASRKPVAQAQGISTQSKQAAGAALRRPRPRSEAPLQLKQRAGKSGRWAPGSGPYPAGPGPRTPRLVTRAGLRPLGLDPPPAGRASRPGCCEPVGCPQQLRDLASGKRTPTSPPPRSHPSSPAACACPRPEPPARRGLQT
ncbi:unnamed protein product [Nyctereutes procyonoides]|uniref:(raccoon dog) hypothetical protein n=1 Tax=Nyctereutes procyonoides TaxID=34880 RepID=A0A811Y8N8_NYCPR|nr:unnamed protein product [Nyctereutes procyonoides]